MAERVGVYVCHCGSNIAGTVDVEEVARWAGTTQGRGRRPRLQVHVLLARPAADRGRHQEGGADPRGRGRLLPAPARKDLPPLLQQRRAEPVPVPDGQHPRARLLGHPRQAAGHREGQGPGGRRGRAASSITSRLEPMPVKVNPATLVVGGGIAGIQAALELADAGYPVYLVEREPSIGGHMAQYDKTFPTLDCAACILTPKMSEVGQHDNIKLLTYSELEEVSRLGRQLPREDPPEGPLCHRGQVHGLRPVHREVPAARWSTTYSKPAWAIARRSTRRSRRPCPRFPAIDTKSCIWFEGQVPGLREALPDRRGRLRPEGRDPRGRRRQHHPGHGLGSVRLPAHPAIRLRPAGQRLHQPGIRADVQRRRSDGRADRAPRRRHRAETRVHRPLRRQPRRPLQHLLLRHSAACRR